MARFTVEDCMEIVPNRFELTLLAVIRTRQIVNGATVSIEHKASDKPAVLALREIAAGVAITIDD